jgi:ribosomal protein S18 acetylase RimI-like enzyme
MDRGSDRGRLGVLVHRKSRLIGSVTITPEDTLIWGKQDELAGYIHMLMVDRTFAGHGVGRSVLGWCEATIEADSRTVARLDCVRSNERLRRYYEDAGYLLVGFRDFPEIEWARETALYEKRLGKA